MPAFEYEALNAAGKRTRGLITADSELAARRQLRGQSLAPLSIGRADASAQTAGADRDPAATAPGLAVSLRRQHLSARERMLVTRQLASLIDAGMPIAEALGLIGNQLDKHHLRRILLAVRSRVTEGERFAEALSAFPKSFPPVYCALIAAGEGSGSLGVVMERLSDHLEKEAAVRNRITGALIYPALLSVVAIGVVAMLMLFVVPRIAEQFTGMGVTLPGLTRFMMGVSDFLVAAWPVLLGLVLVLVVGGGLALSREPVRRQFDRLVSRLPLLGGFLRQAEAAQFARTMGILVSSGTVLPDGLRAARRAAGNLAFQDAITAVIRDVETGQPLSETMKASQWFPPLMLYMIAAGERSGRLGDMFRRSADQLDQDIDTTITIGLNLLEPGIILVLGGVVVTIVLSILLPILQLNTLALG